MQNKLSNDVCQKRSVTWKGKVVYILYLKCAFLFMLAPMCLCGFLDSILWVSHTGKCQVSHFLVNRHGSLTSRFLIDGQDFPIFISCVVSWSCLSQKQHLQCSQSELIVRQRPWIIVSHKIDGSVFSILGCMEIVSCHARRSTEKLQLFLSGYITRIIFCKEITLNFDRVRRSFCYFYWEWDLAHVRSTWKKALWCDYTISSYITWKCNGNATKADWSPQNYRQSEILNQEQTLY